MKKFINIAALAFASLLCVYNISQANKDREQDKLGWYLVDTGWCIVFFVGAIGYYNNLFPKKEKEYDEMEGI